IAFLFERLAGLRARVVELTRLTNDDGPGTDDENGFDVGPLRHVGERRNDNSPGSRVRRPETKKRRTRDAGPGTPDLMRRFVEWDQIEVRVNGDKLNAFAQQFRIDPIEWLDIRFENGLMRIFGAIRKFISVPFEVQI